MKIIKRTRKNAESALNKLKSATDSDRLNEDVLNGQKISENIDENLAVLKEAFKNCFDIKFRKFNIKNKIMAVLVYIEGITDKVLMNEHVLEPLIIDYQKNKGDKNELDSSIEYIKENLLLNSEIKDLNSIDKVILSVADANAVLIIDGFSTAIEIGAQKWEGRSIDKPDMEANVRGPKEGFVENLKTNLSLVRKRMKISNFKAEEMQIGKLTRTKIAICYIDGIVNREILDEVKVRLQRIDTDIILADAYIEEYIEDSPFSIFPQIRHTQRPDVVAASLAEGRVAIIIDGNPTPLIVPMVFVDALNSSEDYYDRYWHGSATRILRYVFFMIALLGPAAYIAFTTFHQEMIPITLLTTIAQSRAGVPFPAIIEALLMEIAFEALREAGIRLPKAVGQSVSIVGALVIGEAAVQAGIVSTAMVIVVAATGIASFTIPNYSFGIAVRILRFPIMILASILGLFGIILALFAILIHLASLRSFGIPYLSPMAPMTVPDLKDILIRSPHWREILRPTFISKINVQRKSREMKPGREKHE